MGTLHSLTERCQQWVNSLIDSILVNVNYVNTMTEKEIKEYETRRRLRTFSDKKMCTSNDTPR